MRIQKSKHNARAAVVTMGRNSVWGGKEEFPDARDLDIERARVRKAAREFCGRHGLTQYEVFAAANGGHTIEVVDLRD